MASSNPIEGLVNLLRTAGLGSDGDPLTTLFEQGRSLKAINEAIAQQQAAMLAQGTTAVNSGGSSILGAIGGFLGSGLGVAPLISGLAGVFGGGGEQNSLPAFHPFVAPMGIHIDAGFSNSAGRGVFGLDAASGGSARAITQAAPQITVQVNAMDSQSFLDRSQDIANAVRQAMLETTVLNDVIREV